MKSTTTTLIILSSLSVALLTAQADMLYWGGGTTDKADNTALPTTVAAFSGDWNTTTKNWASTNAPGPYTSYGADAWVNLGFVTDITGNGGKVAITLADDVSLSGLMSFTKGDNVNQAISLTASSPRVMTLTGSNVFLNTHASTSSGGLMIEANVALAGSAPMTSLASLGVFTLKSASPNFTGAVAIRDRTIRLEGGTMEGVPSWTLNTLLHLLNYDQAYTIPELFVSRTSTGVQNQLGDNVAITFQSGTLTYRGADSATTPSTEATGKIVLEPFGLLGLYGVNYWNTNAPNPKPRLILTDPLKGIERGADGVGTLAVSVADYDGNGVPISFPTADVVISNGVPTDVLLPWIYTSHAEFMQVDGSSKVLKKVESTPAPVDPNTWVASGNYRCGTNAAWTASTTLTNDLTINSLGFMPKTSTATLTINSGKILTIATGGLTRQGAAAATITGGTITSGTDMLYINDGTTSAANSLTLASSISGVGMALIKSGNGTTLLSGPDSNTYTGTTYLQGRMQVSKTGTAVGIPGDLVIMNGGKFQSYGTAPLSSTSEVTIHDGGVWSCGTSFTQTAPMTIAGGAFYFQNVSPGIQCIGTGLQFNGGRIVKSQTITSSFNLQTDVGYAASATTQARWEQLYSNPGIFKIELDGAARTFDIADSATLTEEIPEMVVSAQIVDGSPAGGSLVKIGTGVLMLTDANTFTGGIAINGGTLRVGLVTAPAQSGLKGAMENGWPYRVTFNQPVARNMAVRQVIRSASNTGITSAQAITDVINDYQIVVTSTGGTAQPNDIQVDAISRSGSLGKGPAIVNDTGTLKIDAGISLANAVTVNAGGTIAASGAGIGALTLASGATFAADLAAGSMGVTNAATITGATLTLTGTVGNAPTTLLTAGSITGKFASIPEKVSVRYYPTYVTVERMKGLVIVVR